MRRNQRVAANDFREESLKTLFSPNSKVSLIAIAFGTPANKKEVKKTMRIRMTAADTPIATAARYEAGVLTVQIAGEKTLPGANLSVSFNPRALRFFAEPSDELLARVEILHEGHLLYWRELDTEVPVVKMLERLTGLTDLAEMTRMAGLKGAPRRAMLKQKPPARMAPRGEGRARSQSKRWRVGRPDLQ